MFDMTRKVAAELDAVFHALADSTRRTILEELSNRDEQSLFEICVRLVEGHGLSMKRQSISKHLAVLEDAGPDSHELARTNKTPLD